MIRATIEVREPEQVEQAYNKLNELSKLSIIRLINALDTPMSNVTVNIMWDYQIIGEIVIACAPKPHNADASEFLQDMTRIDNHIQFR